MFQLIRSRGRQVLGMLRCIRSRGRHNVWRTWRAYRKRSHRLSPLPSDSVDIVITINSPSSMTVMYYGLYGCCYSLSWKRHTTASSAAANTARSTRTGINRKNTKTTKDHSHHRHRHNHHQRHRHCYHHRRLHNQQHQHQHQLLLDNGLSWRTYGGSRFRRSCLRLALADASELPPLLYGTHHLLPCHSYPQHHRNTAISTAESAPCWLHMVVVIVVTILILARPAS